MSRWVGFKTLTAREIYRFLSVFHQTITPPVIATVLNLSVFGLAIGSHMHPIQGFSYIQFILPGMMIGTVIDASYTNTSSSLFISRWSNSIQDILVSPISYVEMVLAILIGSLTRCLVILFFVICAAFFFLPLQVSHPWTALFFLIAISLTLSSLGMIVALFAEEFEHLTMASTFILNPFVFLGGVFYSADMLPPVFRSLVYWNPLFYLVNGFRYGILGISDAPVGTCILIVLALFTVLFSCAVYLFRAGFKLRK